MRGLTLVLPYANHTYESSRASISTKIYSVHYTPHLISSRLVSLNQANIECNLCSFDTAKASRLGTYRKGGR